MKNNSQSCASFLAQKFLAPRPTEPPSVWAEKNFVFNEEEIRGRFDFTGRNYLRKPIDDNNDPNVREQTIVSGTGAGKTITYIVGICWKILFKPCRGIVVWPAQKGEGSSSNFTSTRLIPDIEATPALNDLIPKTGQKRFKLNKQFVRIGGAHFGFVGGNSAGQVAGNRCGDVRMDETDKFPTSLKNEAGTGTLVRNRTEGVTDWQIFDTSTPTIEGAIIWPRLQRSNLYLYFVPCPYCNKGKHGKTEKEREFEARQKKFKGWMVYAWNEQFAAGLPTMIGKLKIPFAYVRWSRKAKGRDGLWNFQQVQDSAHFECPHCKEKIFDFKVGQIFPDTKNWMDENGVWILAKPGVPKHVGYHVSSLYAPVINEESTVGGRAVKFLSAMAEGDLRDFINSTLALPEVGQQHNDGSVIQIGDGLIRTSANLYLPMMSCDRQEKYPGFWYVVRNWIVSVLRPLENEKVKNDAFLRTIPGYAAGLGNNEILLNLCRCDHWQKIVGWLIEKKLTGDKLKEYFRMEFENNLIRLIEFCCKEMKIRFPKQGDSEALEVGSADSWEEIDDAQQRHKVANIDVICDARFGSMDNAEVFAECFRRCPKEGFVFYTPIQSVGGIGNKFSSAPFPGGKPFALNGWTPCMGFPEHKTWLSREKVRLPYGQIVNDPFSGKMEQKQFFQYVFQFDAQWSLEELERIRKKYSWQLSPEIKFHGNNAEMNPVTLADYNKHMKGYYLDEREGIWMCPAKEGGSQARRYPNHLYDCEKNMAARAVWKGIFKYDRNK